MDEKDHRFLGRADYDLAGGAFGGAVFEGAAEVESQEFTAALPTQRVPRHLGFQFIAASSRRSVEAPQGLGCSLSKAVLEVGSEPRETVRSLSVEGAAPKKVCCEGSA